MRKLLWKQETQSKREEDKTDLVDHCPSEGVLEVDSVGFLDATDHDVRKFA